MLDFRSFLSEEAEGKKLKHLTHVEDNIFDGHEGVGRADEHLRAMHDLLMGKKANSFHVSDKYDGAPSVIFGQHPENNQFFVSTKSAHNKNPKINFTEEDIDRNHGHAPGLAAKLKSALKHLPAIMPRHGGVYQGDLMHTEGDATNKDGMTSVTPNTITYSAPSDSEEGKAMNKKLGIVVHTQNALKDARPLDDKTRAAFNQSSDVNNIDPTMKINPDNYTEDERKQFLTHMHAARKTYASMKPEAMDALEGHSVPIQAHINNMIRTDGTPSVDGYMQHLTDRHNKDLEKTKTPAARDRKAAAHAAVLDHIMQNREHFDKALQLHNHLTNAKNVLVNTMEKNAPYAHSIGDEPTGKEGTVIVNKKTGDASKLNNRKVFNKLNALKGAFSAKKQPEAFDEEPDAPEQSQRPNFNPGTPVYVQHGSHSKVKTKLRESISKYFNHLIEKKMHMPYQEMMNDEDYTDARDATLNHLRNENDLEKTLLSDNAKNKNPHIKHLKQYAKGSWQLNNDLFDHHNEGGDPNEMPMTQDWDHIEGLDNALKHSKLNKPMTVFSGVGFHPGKLASKDSENRLYMPAYTSTSIDPHIAAKFAKPLIKGSTGEDGSHMYDPENDENEGADHHVLKINLPKGHNGHYIASHSEYPEEKEFLLPRQQSMQIDPKPEIHEFHDGTVKHRMHIWNATPAKTVI